MEPHEASFDGKGSADVLTETPVANPSDAGPMISPDSTNSAAPEAGIVPESMEITTRSREELSTRNDKAEGEVKLEADVEENKLAGKSMVTVLLEEQAPPALT
jgi:hypothetical protein